MAFYVYILASRKNGTLYVGSTENLTVRISEHKQHLRPGFTSRYGVDLLVWFEVHDTRQGAFRRERCIKEWKRAWKVRLIEKGNLEWRDLYDEHLYGDLSLELPLAPPDPADPSNPAHPGEGRDPGQVTQEMKQAFAVAPQRVHADSPAPTCPGSRPSPG